MNPHDISLDTIKGRGRLEVESFGKLLECTYCYTDMADDPVIHGRCEKLFCRKCIVDYFHTGAHTCPGCMNVASVDDFHKPIILTELLHSMTFQCTEPGCLVRIPYNELHTHSQECLEVYVQCAYCHANVKRKHPHECPHVHNDASYIDMTQDDGNDGNDDDEDDEDIAWVRCVACKKWRVNESNMQTKGWWACSMNSNVQFNRCDIPAEREKDAIARMDK